MIRHWMENCEYIMLTCWWCGEEAKRMEVLGKDHRCEEITFSQGVEDQATRTKLLEEANKKLVTEASQHKNEKAEL
jgi:hypothetical protein